MIQSSDQASNVGVSVFSRYVSAGMTVTNHSFLIYARSNNKKENNIILHNKAKIDVLLFRICTPLTKLST